MAAYWRSPYREPSNYSFRQPNHSTLKFEQSLYLSRARTSISSSKYDWFDSAFHPSAQRTVNPNNLSRSNTTIKSILKTPKRDIRLLPRKEADSNSCDESTEANLEAVKKEQKKRVTFGLNDDAENENEKSISFNHMHNRKCQSMTMKRISHSRLLEESALKKLNRLIGGIAHGQPLPSVTGKGLLSPKPSSPRPACSHSPDLKCIRCIRKDVEHDNCEISHRKLNVNETVVTNSIGTLHPEEHENTDNNSTNISNSSDVNNIMKGRLAPGQVNTENGGNNLTESLILNKEEIKHLYGNGQAASASIAPKKHHRLLPGRYPYNSGAMQIKKLLTSDEQCNELVAAAEGADVIGLQPVSVDTRNKSSPNQIREISQRKTPRGANNSNSRINSGFRIPTLKMPSSILEVEAHALRTGKGDNNENVSYDSENAGSNTNRKSSKDKTSDILDWLNDVHQKQPFKPRLSQLHALES